MTAHAPRVTIGEAIREVRGGMTQTELASAVGTDQGTVSKWETGGLNPSFDDLPKIEEACGVARGTILRRAGYVAELTSLKDWLEADSSILPANIDLVLQAVESARKPSR